MVSILDRLPRHPIPYYYGDFFVTLQNNGKSIFAILFSILNIFSGKTEAFNRYLATVSNISKPTPIVSSSLFHVLMFLNIFLLNIVICPKKTKEIIYFSNPLPASDIFYLEHRILESLIRTSLLAFMHSNKKNCRDVLSQQVIDLRSSAEEEVIYLRFF